MGPHFRRLETDLDFNGAAHGRDGPIPIRRIPPQDWPPFCRSIADALSERGFPYVPDANGDFRDGVVAAPLSNLSDRRVTTAMAYLGPDVRTRGNLTILADTTVQGLVLEAAKGRWGRRPTERASDPTI